MKKKPVPKTKPWQDYDAVLSGVIELLDAARRTSARTVISIMTATYWEVRRRKMSKAPTFRDHVEAFRPPSAAKRGIKALFLFLIALRFRNRPADCLDRSGRGPARRGRTLAYHREFFGVALPFCANPAKPPVTAKVLTPEEVGQAWLEEVVDSKRMTPATERNADEPKIAGEVLPRLRQRYAGRGREGRSHLIEEVCEQWGYSRKHAIKLLGAKAGWGGDPAGARGGHRFTAKRKLPCCERSGSIP